MFGHISDFERLGGGKSMVSLGEEIAILLIFIHGCPN
jgi:hypothetical protein